MRILFLENHPMWVHGLPNGFRQLGHQVRTYFPDANTSQASGLFRPHLVIVMGWTPANDTVEKQLRISKAVRKSEVPLVYWATEDPGYHRKFSRRLYTALPAEAGPFPVQVSPYAGQPVFGKRP
ncbi:hypothetical protein QJ48_05265 [Paenibacillus sp. A3]|nr:hypothetical protein QJ48_05265 [Paenibacillus sp. A3]